MIENPKVSIVIPVYNGSNYLKEAVDSALSQTYKNVEIIVINDGSNDGGKTETLAKSYGDKIKYYYKENGGVASALNFGIKVMKGEYFSWLSHDDVYFNNKIELQISHIKKINYFNKKAIFFSGCTYINESGNFLNKKYISYSGEYTILYFLIYRGWINGCSLLIPKYVFTDVGTFKEKLITTQDTEMWLRMLFNNYEFIYIPINSVKFRLHKNQGTNIMHDLQIKELDNLFLWVFKNFSEKDIFFEKKNLVNYYLAFYYKYKKIRLYKTASFIYRKINCEKVNFKNNNIIIYLILKLKIFLRLYNISI
jgi:glycosyltransferase involved in cell wall biosynthesis